MLGGSLDAFRAVCFLHTLFCLCVNKISKWLFLSTGYKMKQIKYLEAADRKSVV